MKVGIKKLHENEWLVHVGCARIKMDRFAVELLNITLEHMAMLESGQSHSTVKSYIKLGLKLVELDDRALQKVLSRLDNRDVLTLLLSANSDEVTQKVLHNIGGILSKQLQADLQQSEAPSEQQIKQSVENIAETLFAMEADGEVEFIKDDVQYI